MYGPALKEAGLDRQPCAVPRQRTVGRHIRDLDEDALTHRDRVLLPIRQRLARERPPEAGPVLRHFVECWHDLVRSQRNPAVPASTNRLEGWLGRFKPRARLTRRLKTEADTLNFVRLMARGMA